MKMNIKKYRLIPGITQEDYLGQLCEECGELIQSAEKLQRITRGTNPSPVSAADCWENIREELADVLLCMILVIHRQQIPLDDVAGRMDRKYYRWRARTFEKRQKEKRLQQIYDGLEIEKEPPLD